MPWNREELKVSTKLEQNEARVILNRSEELGKMEAPIIVPMKKHESVSAQTRKILKQA